jgi:hypothetical protein
MAVDVTSILPFSHIFKLLEEDDGAVQAQGFGALKAIRLLRLLKLLRMFRMFHIFHEYLQL